MRGCRGREGWGEGSSREEGRGRDRRVVLVGSTSGHELKQLLFRISLLRKLN